MRSSRPAGRNSRSPVNPWGAGVMASVRVVAVGEGLPGHEQVVTAGRALLLGQRLGVAHGDAEAVVQGVVADLGDRAETQLRLPPHSQLGTAVPNWYLDWKPSACRSRSPTSVP